jgi:hypothetical protein
MEYLLVLLKVEDNSESPRKIGKRASVELILEDFRQVVAKTAKQSAPIGGH